MRADSGSMQHGVTGTWPAAALMSGAFGQMAMGMATERERGDQL
jgi:hypothetical protein